MDERGFELTMELQHGMQFLVDFGVQDLPPLLMDEPEPVGDDQGPNATRLLAAAVGNCLSASALFCFRKARVTVDGMRTEVRTRLVRNENGRVRVGAIEVDIHPEVSPEDWPRLRRCIDVFQDFCIVSQSVKQGIDISVEVKPPADRGATEPQSGLTPANGIRGRA
ncbi:MAG: OsmC family protein [Gemmatimonadota bacterium]